MMKESATWYGRMRWRKIARAQIRKEPLCAFCLASGLVVPASVADHIRPHHGDAGKFWFGALQSLCTSCHSMTKQQAEARGFSNEIDDTGWPVDPRHPANRRARPMIR